MIDFLIVFSVLGIIIGTVALIVVTVLRKNKKVLLCGVGIAFIVFVIMVVIYPRNEPVEPPPYSTSARNGNVGN